MDGLMPRLRRRTSRSIVEHTLCIDDIPDHFLRLPSVVEMTQRKLQRAKRRLTRLAENSPPGHRYHLLMGKRTLLTIDSGQADSTSTVVIDCRCK